MVGRVDQEDEEEGDEEDEDEIDDYEQDGDDLGMGFESDV